MANSYPDLQAHDNDKKRRLGLFESKKNVRKFIEIGYIVFEITLINQNDHLMKLTLPFDYLIGNNLLIRLNEQKSEF